MSGQDKAIMDCVIIAREGKALLTAAEKRQLRAMVVQRNDRSDARAVEASCVVQLLTSHSSRLRALNDAITKAIGRKVPLIGTLMQASGLPPRSGTRVRFPYTPAGHYVARGWLHPAGL